jgi:hypothetical protein
MLILLNRWHGMSALFLIMMISCSTPTTSEQIANQSWEPRYQEYQAKKRKVVTPQDAVELLALALQAKGITYRSHILSNVPRWEETVYGAFLEMPYPYLIHQEAIEKFMKNLGYVNKGVNSRREITKDDQERILNEFSRCLGLGRTSIVQARP